jgi:hypothetical protein
MISWNERSQGSPMEYENAQKRILEVFTQWKTTSGSGYGCGPGRTRSDGLPRWTQSQVIFSSNILNGRMLGLDREGQQARSIVL